MSFKAKDLHFDKSQPAFLQRLRGQLGGGDSDRHAQPIARNKRKNKDDDDDDAPTYVMEDTNQSLTKEEYDALLSGKDGEQKEDPVVDEAVKERLTETTSKSKNKIAEVGANAKKRKAAKIVGDDQPQEESKDSKPAEAKVVKKPKRKTKAVKLTFGDGDDG